MKALTIKQPWLHLILHEGKDIENRSWPPRNFSGWFALHAAGTPRREVDLPRGVKMPDLKTLDYSTICGVARVVKCVESSRSRWFYRPDDGTVNLGWVLKDVTALPKPIRRRNGKLKLWNLDPRDVRNIKRQLPHIDFDE